MRRQPRCHSRRDTQDLPTSHLLVQQLLSTIDEQRRALGAKDACIKFLVDQLAQLELDTHSRAQRQAHTTGGTHQYDPYDQPSLASQPSEDLDDEMMLPLLPSALCQTPTGLELRPGKAPSASNPGRQGQGSSSSRVGNPCPPKAPRLTTFSCGIKRPASAASTRLPLPVPAPGSDPALQSQPAGPGTPDRGQSEQGRRRSSLEELGPRTDWFSHTLRNKYCIGSGCASQPPSLGAAAPGLQDPCHGLKRMSPNTVVTTSAGAVRVHCHMASNPVWEADGEVWVVPSKQPVRWDGSTHVLKCSTGRGPVTRARAGQMLR